MSPTLELLRAAKEGDREACEKAVLENNGLIWSVVRRYYGRGIDPEDLYQLGCRGFLKAVQGFDTKYGTQFSSARERLRQESGREPTLSELSGVSGLSPEEIAQIDLATEVPDSLQRETADGLTLEGTIGTAAPEEAMVERIALRQAIDHLPEKERMTILLRYFKSLTQEQTARILGVSQVQISRLERRGLQRLRESFRP